MAIATWEEHADRLRERCLDRVEAGRERTALAFEVACAAEEAGLVPGNCPFESERRRGGFGRTRACLVDDDGGSAFVDLVSDGPGREAIRALVRSRHEREASEVSWRSAEDIVEAARLAAREDANGRQFRKPSASWSWLAIADRWDETFGETGAVVSEIMSSGVKMELPGAELKVTARKCRDGVTEWTVKYEDAPDAFERAGSMRARICGTAPFDEIIEMAYGWADNRCEETGYIRGWFSEDGGKPDETVLVDDARGVAYVMSELGLFLDHGQMRLVLNNEVDDFVFLAYDGKSLLHPRLWAVNLLGYNPIKRRLSWAAYKANPAAGTSVPAGADDLMALAMGSGGEGFFCTLDNIGKRDAMDAVEILQEKVSRLTRGEYMLPERHRRHTRRLERHGAGRDGITASGSFPFGSRHLVPCTKLIAGEGSTIEGSF